jgi:hypothetical protein
LAQYFSCPSGSGGKFGPKWVWFFGKRVIFSALSCDISGGWFLFSDVPNVVLFFSNGMYF